MIVDLTQMLPGERGVVSGIQGGYGLMRRIQTMGIRPGKRIIKVSSHFWRGPQTVQVDKVQFAIGFGMAKRILIQVERAA